MPQQPRALPNVLGPFVRPSGSRLRTLYAALLGGALLAPTAQAADSRLVGAFTLDGAQRVGVTVQPAGSAGLAQTLFVRVGEAEPVALATLDDEEVDVFDSGDFDGDGHDDFLVGQSGGTQNVQTRMFRYDPTARHYVELQHPGGAASPCKGFVSITRAEDPDDHSFFGSCRYSVNSYGHEVYRFDAEGKVVPTVWQVPVSLDSSLEPIEVVTRFSADGSVSSIDIEGDNDLPLGPDKQVLVSRLDLYDAPDAARRSGMYVVENDRVAVLDAKPGGWIKIRYDSKRAGELVKWVRYDEMTFDKYAYGGPAKSPQALALNVFDYFGRAGDALASTFTLTVDNPTDVSVALQNPRIRLLLIGDKNQRTLHSLYTREPVTLGPHAGGRDGSRRATGGQKYKPGATWDDNPVQWIQQADGSRRYVLHVEGAAYVTFLPPLVPGRYRMIAVLTDPALERPVYANEVTFDYPLQAEQIDEPEGESGD
ncbi:hypothetical protein [Bordetella genomosp. 1]|uniref:hypothetical protein n=1 Tax=Bordetella genomosp. 1 TaxID=1395607 RepID=UPI0011785AD7|nr:hypothetical protein [Bordetella genomosp. 1]